MEFGSKKLKSECYFREVKYCSFIQASFFYFTFNCEVSLDFSREKEEQLTRVTEVQRLQAQQADAALEEFKRQVELNSEKVYAEMKEQVRRPLDRLLAKSLSQ